MMDPHPKLCPPIVRWSEAQWSNFEAFLAGCDELNGSKVSGLCDAARAAHAETTTRAAERRAARGARP
jgi:hypothetical protein